MASALTAYALLAGGMFEQYRHDGRLLADRTQDWRGAVRWLNGEYAVESVPVLVRSGLLEANRLTANSKGQLVEYCLLPVNSIYRLQALPPDLIPLRTTGLPLLFEQTVQRIAERGGVWLVINAGRESRSRIVTDIREVLEERGFSNRILQSKAFGDVGIFQLQVLPHPSAPEQ